MFGICTYNRKDIMCMSANSLSRIKDLGEIDVRVYDDASEEYGIDFLREYYPYAKSIVIAEANKGADINSLRMLHDFLNAHYDWLFIADSDLLFAEGIVATIESCIAEYKQEGYKGVISLFNTFTHPCIGKVNELLCRKEEVGAAGVLVKRDIVELIIKNVKSDIPYDVQFSRELREKGYDILCTNKSFVQHIGIEGYNSLYYTFDWGKEFVLDSLQNAKALNAVFDMLMEKIANDQNKSIQSRLYEDIEKKRIGLKILAKCFFQVSKKRIAHN